MELIVLDDLEEKRVLQEGHPKWAKVDNRVRALLRGLKQNPWFSLLREINLNEPSGSQSAKD